MRSWIHTAAGQQAIEVVLSRRNLLALLHKLEMPGSARTLSRVEDEEPVGC